MSIAIFTSPRVTQNKNNIKMLLSATEQENVETCIPSYPDTQSQTNIHTHPYFISDTGSLLSHGCWSLAV